MNPNRRSSRTATLAVATALIGGSAAGVALFTPAIAGAQDTEAETSTDESDRGAWLTDALAPLVTDGTITQAQADAVAEALVAARPDRPVGHHGGPFGSEVLTDLLGIDRDVLREALASGQTLAEVAEANGVDRQTLVDTLVAEHQTRLDDAVADGRIDETEADERAADIVDHVESLVDGERSARSPGFGRRGPGF